MREAGEPTWRLVLLAAQRLDAVTGEFRMQDLVAEVQRIDPARGRSSIQPVIQGMTANAGSGPASPCGKPLTRAGHGVYRIGAAEHEEAAGADGARRAALSRPSGRRAERPAELAGRLAGVTWPCIEAGQGKVARLPYKRAIYWDRANLRMRIGPQSRCQNWIICTWMRPAADQPQAGNIRRSVSMWASWQAVGELTQRAEDLYYGSPWWSCFSSYRTERKADAGHCRTGRACVLARR
jgi:hypothetical protein